MHRIGVVGISWRHRRADVLGAFTIPREEREERVPKLAATTGVRELVYLATCNRVEVAFAIDGATPIAACRRQLFAALAGREPHAGEAEHTLRIWQGEGAAEHLFLMTAGLDSARGADCDRYWSGRPSKPSPTVTHTFASWRARTVARKPAAIRKKAPWNRKVPSAAKRRASPVSAPSRSSIRR